MESKENTLYQMGNVLRELRKLNNMTQKEVAEKIGIRHQSYQAYEAGKTLPTLENFYALCVLFDVTPNYLLGISNY